MPERLAISNDIERWCRAVWRSASPSQAAAEQQYARQRQAYIRPGSGGCYAICPTHLCRTRTFSSAYCFHVRHVPRACARCKPLSLDLSRVLLLQPTCSSTGLSGQRRFLRSICCETDPPELAYHHHDVLAGGTRTSCTINAEAHSERSAACVAVLQATTRSSDARHLPKSRKTRLIFVEFWRRFQETGRNPLGSFLRFQICQKFSIVKTGLQILLQYQKSIQKQQHTGSKPANYKPGLTVSPTLPVHMAAHATLLHDGLHGAPPPAYTRAQSMESPPRFLSKPTDRPTGAFVPPDARFAAF